MTPQAITILALLAAAGPLAAAAPTPLDLRLPTGNNHLFDGKPEKFFMYVDRTFEGERSTPWQGGQYGFVRNPHRTESGLVYTRFHEGIDIGPVKRDRAGNPLDLVNSIGPGVVVHASTNSRHSNYGKYAVVRHDFEGGPFFSLYAHLADILCRPGDRVRAGGVLGRMGYTGSGITRVRAHLHLEFGIIMHSQFEGWHASFAGGTNRHGVYNGMNLAGMDITRLFQTHRKQPKLSIPAFVRSTPVHFKVLVPRKGNMEIHRRYPWLLTGTTPSPSWEISFSNTGFPLAVAPYQQAVSSPTVSYTKPTPVRPWMVTRSLVHGSGEEPYLGPSGKSLIALLTGSFPPAPPPKPASGSS